MSMATGKYVSFHDSDDWLHPSKIEISVNKLEENQDIVAVFSNYFRVDENGNFIFRGLEHEASMYFFNDEARRNFNKNRIL